MTTSAGVERRMVPRYGRTNLYILVRPYPILVGLGDFEQTPGPTSIRIVLHYSEGARVLLLRFCVIIIFCALN